MKFAIGLALVLGWIGTLTGTIALLAIVYSIVPRLHP